MKIVDINAYPLRNDLWNPWCVITVETDAGLRGVGEAGGLWANTDLDAKVAHVEKYSEWLREEDPRCHRIAARDQPRDAVGTVPSESGGVLGHRDGLLGHRRQTPRDSSP